VLLQVIYDTNILYHSYSKHTFACLGWQTRVKTRVSLTSVSNSQLHCFTSFTLLSLAVTILSIIHTLNWKCYLPVQWINTIKESLWSGWGGGPTHYTSDRLKWVATRCCGLWHSIELEYLATLILVRGIYSSIISDFSQYE